jgi:hypothetical protein
LMRLSSSGIAMEACVSMKKCFCASIVTAPATQFYRHSNDATSSHTEKKRVC